MYLEIDEGFITHRKTLRFCGLMQDQNAFAYLMRLWSWATRGAPDGSLAGMDPTDIEIAVQYRLMDGKCFRAMVAAGFIDTDASGNPTEVHNWSERTGGAIARMESAAKASRTRKERWKERQRNADGTRSGTAEERDGDAEETAENGPGTHQDKTSPVQSSPAKARQEDQRAPAGARDLWPAWTWFQRFKVLWPEAHGKVAYGDGDDDAKATGDLEDKLNSLPGEARIADQERANELIAGYFAIASARAAAHPWKWFVTRFNELRVPASARAGARGSPPRDVRVGTGRAEDVKHTVTGEQAI